MENINGYIIVTVISITLLTGVFLALFNYFRKQIKEELKNSQEQYLQLAKQQFEAEQNKATTELETRRQAVELSVTGLKEELEKYKKLMHDFEQDRATKYGNLENELKNASQNTIHLQETTNKLNNILGNVKLRGQWGERMAEDIIQCVGLVEGVNYKKQTKLDESSTKPDFTFLLPDQHKVNMDAKFPFDNYKRIFDTNDEGEKERLLQLFMKDVKERIKEIQNRDYVNPSENTLDFVLLFIPNEQVFGLIHEKMPSVMDDALKQKVVLCSPFTLYAMLSIIRQSFENFRYEKDLKKIIQLIDQFAKLYDTFKRRFDQIGVSIESLESIYHDVKDKSFKGIDTKIRHIHDYKKGQGIALLQPEEELLDVTSESIDDKTKVS